MMEKVTLKINDYLDLEIKEYLENINGISKVNVNQKRDSLTVSYDINKISIYIIWEEILLFLDNKNHPCLMEFNKHKYGKDIVINIKDLCCEYCLFSNIAHLLLNEGILSLRTDFDFINKYDVKYNNKLIDENELANIEILLNN